jgi:hypothetical protein
MPAKGLMKTKDTAYTNENKRSKKAIEVQWLFYYNDW